MSEYTPSYKEVKSMYEEGKIARTGLYEELEFDRWLAENNRGIVLDERDRVTRILSDRSKFWLNESKREDINLKQREHCEDRAEILSNAIALIVWDDEEGNNV